ncbi:MAG TPA: hypothetical protein VNN10_13385 [Dehalococcoidia bacterium]|nr:hypothetical protein [Dehalococcoidia bacterium]
MPRGGKRPGAGAPAGNTNALKQGAYSRRIRRATLLLLILPEVQDLLRAILRARAADSAALFREFVAVARYAASQDPKIEESIRQVIRKRVLNASPALQTLLQRYLDREKTILQSNESLVQEIFPRSFPPPRPVDPALVPLFENWDGGHCPLIECCLLLDKPCEFTRPWLEPHPFWRVSRGTSEPFPDNPRPARPRDPWATARRPRGRPPTARPTRGSANRQAGKPLLAPTSSPATIPQDTQESPRHD